MQVVLRGSPKVDDPELSKLLREQQHSILMWLYGHHSTEKSDDSSADQITGYAPAAESY